MSISKIDLDFTIYRQFLNRIAYAIYNSSKEGTKMKDRTRSIDLSKCTSVEQATTAPRELCADIKTGDLKTTVDNLIGNYVINKMNSNETTLTKYVDFMYDLLKDNSYYNYESDNPRNTKLYDNEIRSCKQLVEDKSCIITETNQDGVVSTINNSALKNCGAHEYFEYVFEVLTFAFMMFYSKTSNNQQSQKAPPSFQSFSGVMRNIFILYPEKDAILEVFEECFKLKKAPSKKKPKSTNKKTPNKKNEDVDDQFTYESESESDSEDIIYNQNA